ncbi:MAG TPA: hypothetical protein VN381_02020 [Anaerovoracaceae bacterium]|nr:hypothetical protein [Anaerovoracaceae bacterium]
MKRKIVDIMQDLDSGIMENMENTDLEVLGVLDLTETEIERLSQGADMEKIWRAAFKKIQCEAPENIRCVALEKTSIPGQDPMPAEREHRRKRSGLRIAVAVILALCLSGTVFAIHQWYMEDFFGKGSVPGERLDRVLESQVSGGVRMTLAEVIAGEQDANVIVYFERVDGKPFPVRTEAAALEFQLSTAFEGQQALDSRMIQMLEDNHKLAYCYNMMAFESILGETLNINASYIFQEKMRKEILDADLSEQFSAYPIRIESKILDPSDGILEDRVFSEQAVIQRAAAEPVTMPLEKEYPQLQFAGVAFIDGKLAIATYTEAGGSGADAMEAKVSSHIRNTVLISELKDSRTGEVYHTAGYSGTGGLNQKLTFEASYFEGLTEKDLPYLTPVAEYSLPELISDGSWSFSYTFEKEEAWKSADTELIIDTEAGPLRITRVSVSTLGVSVQGEWLEPDKDETVPWRPEDDMPVKAVMKGGREKELECIRSQTHWKGVYYKALYGVALERRKTAWEKQFLADGTIEDMEAVVIDGITIPLYREQDEE